ncbi:MAG: phage holin family protein [Limisphaerales bacterium]
MFGLATTGFGFFSSIRRTFDNAVAAVHSRIELAVVELQEERDRAVNVLVWSGVMLFLVFMAIVAFTFCVIVALWQYAVWVGLGFGVLYLVGATVAATIIRKRLKAPLFSETINQLRKDREWLTPSRE